MSLLGLLPINARVQGSATLLGDELIGASSRRLRSVRGRDVGLIFQEPMSALNPVLTIGFQISEVLLSHFDLSPAEVRERVLELMRLVELPDPEARFSAYPHQLSGGQRQRVVIAMALACDPVLLLADEPTTALDVTVQAEILDLLRELHTRLDSAILLITHDMGVVADLADRVVVMRSGEIVETGTVRQVFGQPQHPYTVELLAAVPKLTTGPGSVSVREPAPAAAGPEAVEAAASPGQPVLEVRNLVVEYPGRRRLPAFRAVDDVSLSIERGQVLGLVGESGSGKTTIGRAVASLLPATSGDIVVSGTQMRGLRPRQLKPMRRKVAIVFQDPASSLNPRMSIGTSVAEPLRLHTDLSGAALQTAVEGLLDSVRLPRSYRNRYPHELSGGQRQRVGIARALSLEPDLLIADEPTSALDVSVQAHVLELLSQLQAERGFACLFISHDLAVVEQLADDIAVLHRGRVAEQGPAAAVLSSPQDPYTQRLLAAAPVPDPDAQAIRREARTAVAREQG
jgi:peptide/nickel transport system ATP-binding protein